jgi:hypothetical protein
VLVKTAGHTGVQAIGFKLRILARRYEVMREVTILRVAGVMQPDEFLKRLSRLPLGNCSLGKVGVHRVTSPNENPSAVIAGACGIPARQLPGG